MSRPIAHTVFALLLGLLPLPALAQDGTAFDPAQCPSPVLRFEGDTLVVIYDAQLAAYLGSVPGRVPALEPETGEIQFIDFSQGSIDELIEGSELSLEARGELGEACLAARAGLGTRSTPPPVESFDPATCPAPMLVVENGRATMVYDDEIAAQVPQRPGLVALVNRDTGKIWYYNTAETSLYDILTLHGATITDAIGPVECAAIGAGFPDPTRRTRDLLWQPFDAAIGLPGGSGGTGGKRSETGGAETPPAPAPPPKALTPGAAAACAGAPRAGTWVAEIGATSIEGCPAMMQQAFGQMAGQLPGTGAAQPGRLDFACPFHPDTLELSKTARVRWRETGPGRWTTTDLAAEQFAQIPAGAGGGSQIRWDLTVVSPEEIEFRRSVEIDLPATAAAVMGMPAGGCRIVGTDRWLRQGD